MFNNAKHTFVGDDSFTKLVGSVQIGDGKVKAEYISATLKSGEALHTLGEPVFLDERGFSDTPEVISRYQGLEDNKAHLILKNNFKETSACEIIAHVYF